ncbi:hypothetical protein HPP92_011418 [Vanilla planifolia]|uniref:3-beta hydroxysteroid dehydrogenase/isomerase domain-containing protein n=1 Tax=Vanilla planifolia TaxID=51239 RepID=A0A835R2S6_VANPL|nr:hypothetical protein HPP92_011418 [Vanilla planifolia]
MGEETIDKSTCKGFSALVYVGSADVLVGGEEVFCFDESVAYPEKYVDGLNELRAQTEASARLNRMNGLLTCALSKQSVWSQ